MHGGRFPTGPHVFLFVPHTLLRQRLHFIFFLALSVAGTLAAQQDPDLIRLPTPIVDVLITATGQVRMFSQQMDVYETTLDTRLWTKRVLAIPDVQVRRIGRVIHVGQVVVAVGHIVMANGSASAVLRSTDDGQTFAPIPLGTDTLATADGCVVSEDGHLFFVDHVGRLWTSTDVGATWTSKRFPSPIPPGGVRELDMLDSRTGVCVDGIRGVHYTTSGWASVITPKPSARPILRTQPSMLNGFAWTRDLALVNNMLILHEGSDVYRTASNDLVWERWDTVMVFALAPTRKQVAFCTSTGRLFTGSASATVHTLLDSALLRPHLLRVDGSAVIAYRPDTGPIIYRNGSKHVLPLHDARASLSAPALQSSNGLWGVHHASVDAVNVEIVRKDGKGLWLRDTIVPIGPVYALQTLGTDTVLLTTRSQLLAYVPKAGTFAPYVLATPLQAFLKHPLVRFRISIAADELDSTHLRWCEFVNVGDSLVCAELVDSSRFGVRSQLVNITFSQADVRAVLESVNKRGSSLPDVNFVELTPEVLDDYFSILDTLFSTDAYFDEFDVYKPPPSGEVQARACYDEFARVTEELEKLSATDVMFALRSFRHLPHDGYSRYVIEFQNRSGRIARFQVDRTDEAHPPMMLPWSASVDGRTWLSYDRALSTLLLRAVPAEAVPPMFSNMTRDAWFLVAIASYLDNIRFGRYHRWANRVITPAARF